MGQLESIKPSKRAWGIFNNMKILKVTLTTVAALFLGVGCASTVTVGPDANKDSYLSASASTKGASVTLPLVRAGVSVTDTTKKK